MNAPDRIQKLIETFDYNLEAYRKGSYNETQVRREFILIKQTTKSKTQQEKRC